MSLIRLGQYLLLSTMIVLISSCTDLPEQVRPVEGFKLNQYLGTWYEIARLDHSFEKGMDHVTATYSMREDGGVRVLNRGFLPENNEWKEAEGRAYFVDNTEKAHLRVSFFGPFFGSYAVFELNKEQEDYQYAFISGNTHKYLWLLARSPIVEPALLSHFETIAIENGFDIEKLIYVNQN